MPRFSLLALLVLLALPALAQERPQSTGPTMTPERERAIRDSIRQRSRVQFAESNAAKKKSTRYEPDRALLMPNMERAAIFRIGIPGWALRLGMRVGRDEFDSEEEYRATRELMRGLKSIRVAAFTDNPAYEREQLRKQYARYVKRRRMDPVLLVRAREGGVSIDVKERRGKVKRITLLAYGEEGAAVIRVKSRFRENHLKRAIALLTEEADDALGIKIDTAPD